MRASRRNNSFLAIACHVILVCPVLAQSPQAPHYSLVFHNSLAEGLGLDLPADRVAPIHENQNDLLWIALDDQTITIEWADEQRQDLFLRTRDVRLISRRAVKSIFNSTGGAIQAAIVQIHGLRIPSGTCDCMRGTVETYVCGCAHFHLPALWAEVVGELTLAGATLDPRQSVDEREDREGTLLVAVTPVLLAHEVDMGATRHRFSSTQLELHPGEATWLPAGKHRLRNLSSRPVHFITVEFAPRTQPPTPGFPCLRNPWSSSR
jgi:hypothetical protein